MGCKRNGSISNNAKEKDKMKKVIKKKKKEKS